ncbi:MAG: glutamate--tRNA ligase [Promethearchaeia archaeon]
MDDEEIEKILWIHGLKNALEFEEANKNAVMGKLMAEREDLRPKAKQILPLLDSIVQEINELSAEQQEKRLLELDPSALEEEESTEEDKELPELPNVDKYDKVVMRLAPYPSGALHIGNARMIVLNSRYIEKYDGELILFFDDTIGSPKSLRDSPRAKYVLPESYDLIKEGLEWLGVKYSKVYYKSDRLERFYEYCERLIKDGMAYVCSCTAGEFREKYKKQKKECPHRDFSIERNLERWNKMLDGTYEEMDAVVRLKTGMNQKDPALRDQIIMRISEAAHPRVGTKYRVWPMLEFSWAIDDHLIGATHILRGSDLVKEDFIEEFVWNHFGWPKAEFLHYGRINFPDMKLSKTSTRNKIQKGIYEGWDDPRTWSLQSLRKRGIRPEALKEALLDLGMSLSGVTFSVNWLYSKNQDIIDDISNRYFYTEEPICLTIKSCPFETYNAEPLLLPTKPEKGRRTIKVKTKGGDLKIWIAQKDAQKFEEGLIVRLKDLINVRIDSTDLNQKEIKATFHSEELNREYKIIHWVPHDKDENVPVTVIKPDGSRKEGFGEKNLEDIQLKTPIQFERYGFVNPYRFEDETLICYFTH